VEISDFEKRRADNLIWSAAGDYGIKPGFRVYTPQGEADLYWNSIVGAVYRHFDRARLTEMYDRFRGMSLQTTFESLFWIGMEDAAYEREKDERRVLPALRRDYCRRRLAQGMEDGTLPERILKGHLHHCLGERYELALERDRRILACLESLRGLDTQAALARLTALFEREFNFDSSHEPGEPEDDEEKRHFSLSFRFLAFHKKPELIRPPIRHLVFGVAEHVDEYSLNNGDPVYTGEGQMRRGQTDEGLRRYIENSYGAPMYDGGRVRQMAREYCTGAHAGCRLHFTRGDYGKMQRDFNTSGQNRRRALRAQSENERYYSQNRQACQMAIGSLAERIRSTLVAWQDDCSVRSGSGKLDASRAWRAGALRSGRIFRKTVRGDAGTLAVQLLLDASTSQIQQQQTVAAQAFIIAESLSRCQIPVCVNSFCSMSGYTIFTQLRDYDRPEDNRRIFRYFTSGSNRDGLGIRIAAGRMEGRTEDRKLLIVLSDCRPNDVVKIHTGGGAPESYSGDAGIRDTQAQVHAARLSGVQVLCVYMGDDEKLADCASIYGRGNFARIRDLSLFADTVGSLIREQIRN
jgi:hypothetical protein